MQTLFLLLAVLFPRPPEPVVPFPYDPNQVPCEILRAIEVEPNDSPLYLPLKAYDKDGDMVKLTCNDPNVWIPLSPTTTLDPNDPNGVAVIHRWKCDIPTGTTERVKVIIFTITEVGTTPIYKDERAVLINVRKKPKNHAPILDWDG